MNVLNTNSLGLMLLFWGFTSRVCRCFPPIWNSGDACLSRRYSTRFLTVRVCRDFPPLKLRPRRFVLFAAALHLVFDWCLLSCVTSVCWFRKFFLLLFSSRFLCLQRFEICDQALAARRHFRSCINTCPSRVSIRAIS